MNFVNINKSFFSNFTKNNIMLYLLITFAFSLPLSRGLISVFTLIIPFSWIIVSSIEGNIRQDLHRLIETKLSRTILIFLALFILSMLWSGGPIHWPARMHQFAFLAFLFPIIVMRINYCDAPKILSAFLLGMFLSEIVSYGIFFEWWHYKDIKSNDPSPFMKHIEYSTLLAFSSLLLLSRFYYENEIRSKFVYGLFFITITINLFINGGRTGQVAFIIGLLIVTLGYFKHKIVGLLLAISLMFSILLGAWFSSENFQERINFAVNDIKLLIKSETIRNSFVDKNEISDIDSKNVKGTVCTSLGIRYASYFLAYELFKENPLLGAGWMGHEKLQQDIVGAKFPGWECVIYGHLDFQNQFLLVLVEFGIVGFLIFLLILYYLLKLPIEIQHFKNLRTIFFSVMILYFFSEGLVHHFTGSFFAMILGILVVISQDNDNNVSTAESTSTDSKVIMQS